MEYYDILLNLMYFSAALPRFTSKQLSEAFKIFASTAPPVKLSKKYPPSAFDVKSISGDLDRLYKMRLLKREKMERTVKTKEGKAVVRGYHYVYQLSNQGWKYGTFVAENGPPEARMSEHGGYRAGKKPDDIRTFIEMQIQRKELRPEALDADRILSKYVSTPEQRPANRRFRKSNYDWELFALFLAEKKRADEALAVAKNALDYAKRAGRPSENNRGT